MKKTLLICASLLLLSENAYSSSPLSLNLQDSASSSNETLVTEMTRYQITRNPTYELTHLDQRQVSKKSGIVVTPQNVASVTQTFLDALGEALEETGTATGTRLNSAIDAFAATLQDQKEIIGSTAKDVLEIFETKAMQIFPSESFALSLGEKIRDTKFITGVDGHLEAVRRTPKETCCGILFSILKIFGRGAYDYLQRQSGSSNSTTYPQMYPYIVSNPAMTYQPGIYQMTTAPISGLVSRPPTPVVSSSSVSTSAIPENHMTNSHTSE